MFQFQHVFAMWIRDWKRVCVYRWDSRSCKNRCLLLYASVAIPIYLPFVSVFQCLDSASRVRQFYAKRCSQHVTSTGQRKNLSPRQELNLSVWLSVSTEHHFESVPRDWFPGIRSGQPLMFARLAQWDKRRSTERGGVCSNPAGPTLRVFQ